MCCAGSTICRSSPPGGTRWRICSVNCWRAFGDEDLGVTGIFALIGFALLALRRLMTYLHLFQQEEYDNRRFLAWLVRDRAWDQKLSASLLVVGAMQFFSPHRGVPDWAFGVLAGAICVAIAAFEADP